MLSSCYYRCRVTKGGSFVNSNGDIFGAGKVFVAVLVE